MSNEQQPTDTPSAGVAKPLLTGPKRQHFLPRSYLEGFCKDGKLAVYDRRRRKEA